MPQRVHDRVLEHGVYAVADAPARSVDTIFETGHRHLRKRVASAFEQVLEMIIHGLLDPGGLFSFRRAGPGDVRRRHCG